MWVLDSANLLLNVSIGTPYSDQLVSADFHGTPTTSNNLYFTTLVL